MSVNWSSGSGVTDTGPRPRNEDSFLSDGPVQIVADGMGGHLGGAAASQAVVEAFAPLAPRDTITPDDVEDAIHEAQEAVEALAVELGGESGSTLTGVIAVEHDDQPWWMVVNVGDSRVYALDGGALTQVTVDHSYVQQLVDHGEITAAEAEHHPDRNIVTRAIGDGMRSFDAWLVRAVPGRRFVVASDGLTKALADARIGSIASLAGGPALAAARLLDAALEADANDNVTVVVVDTLHAQTDADADAGPWRMWAGDFLEEDDTTVAGRRRERV